MIGHNQAFATKKKPSNWRKPLNWFEVVIVIILIQFTWIIVLMSGLEHAEISWRLQNKGVTTSGTVAKIHHGAQMSVWPEVTFEVNGKTYAFEFRNRMRRYEVGEQVIVRYDPADPNVAQIDSDERWKYPAFEISFALLIALFCNSLMIWALRARWRQARLLSQSYRLPQ
jgi:hypothetical protein